MREVIAMGRVALEPLHRFHTYCARFPSELAEAGITQYTRTGDSVFDPFCGSGTTLVASLALKRKAIGTDIDTLAGMLSELKCFPLPSNRYARWRASFVQRLEEAFEDIEDSWPPDTRPRPGSAWPVGALQLVIPQFAELNYWFPPQLTAALAAIAKAAHRCHEPRYERAALISLSASIISKWPNTLSYAKDVDHTRPHREVRRFRLNEVLQTYLGRLDRTISCLSALHDAYRSAGVLDALESSAQVIYPHDARQPVLSIPDGSQALVMTSPPYFNAVDYPRAHRMSVCWMNGHAPAELVSRRQYVGLRHGADFAADDWLESRPGIRQLIPVPIWRDPTLARRLSAFFADLEAALSQTWRVLRPGGHALFVIANNVIRGVRVESHSVLVNLARGLGFVEIETNAREIARLRRRFPIGPFGFDGPMTHEYLVVLRKPPTRSRPAKRHRRGAR